MRPVGDHEQLVRGVTLREQELALAASGRIFGLAAELLQRVGRERGEELGCVQEAALGHGATLVRGPAIAAGARCRGVRRRPDSLVSVEVRYNRRLPPGGFS